MIREIDNKERERIETMQYCDIYEGRIKTLYRAYGMDYDFCKFFIQDNSAVISKLDRDFVISRNVNASGAEELAEFLKANAAFSVFLSPVTMKKIENYISGEYLYNNLMEYAGAFEDADIEENPRLDDVYEILRHDFNLIHSTWLTDVSHRVRHGISKAMTYNGVSTVTALYDEDGFVFLTQVATLASARGQGAATNMLRAVAGKYREQGKRVFLACRPKMLGFYEKVGFIKIDEVAQIYRLDI